MTSTDEYRTEFMTPAEVCALFRVDIRTLVRWDKAGKFPAGCVVRTLGGHRRYRADTIRGLARQHGAS